MRQVVIAIFLVLVGTAAGAFVAHLWIDFVRDRTVGDSIGGGLLAVFGGGALAVLAGVIAGSASFLPWVRREFAGHEVRSSVAVLVFTAGVVAIVLVLFPGIDDKDPVDLFWLAAMVGAFAGNVVCNIVRFVWRSKIVAQLLRRKQM
jgi:hypothetical protein